MIIISACLVGVNCRYNELSVENKELLHLINSGKAIAICPEVLGSLPIPRDPCEIQTINGEQRVISKSGRDCTAEFRDGAERPARPDARPLWGGTGRPGDREGGHSHGPVLRGFDDRRRRELDPGRDAVREAGGRLDV